MTFPQFTKLEAISEFKMKVMGQRGKPVSVKVGDLFVITNPLHMQELAGCKIARAKNARLNEGHLIECNQLLQLFKVIENV